MLTARKRILEICLPGVFAIISAIITVSLPVVSLIIAMIIFSWIIYSLKLQYITLMLISLLLPFSFETSITLEFSLLLPTEPLIGVILLSACWDILYNPSALKKLFQKESIWILPLMGWFVVSAIFSAMKVVSFKFAFLNISYILLFFILQKSRLKNHPDDYVTLISLYSLSLAAVVVYSFWQYHGYEFNPVTVRGIYLPFFKDNTIFGASASMIAVFWLVRGMYAKNPAGRLLNIIAGLFFTGAVLYSQSRAAILSLAFFSIIWFLALLRVRLKMILILISVLIFSLFLVRRDLMETLRKNTSISHNTLSDFSERIRSSANISTDISNLERLNRWSAGLAMTSEKPVTGFGPGTYQFTYIPYQRPELYNRLTVYDPWHIPENSGGTAHSEYILILSEMGITGLILLLVFIGRMTFIFFEKSRFMKFRTTVIISFCVLSTYFFHSFFNNFLNTDKIAFLCWGFAAWLFSAYERELL